MNDYTLEYISILSVRAKSGYFTYTMGKNCMHLDLALNSTDDSIQL